MKTEPKVECASPSPRLRGGFTLTNTINGAQQITHISSSWVDSVHPATLAALTYTPFGAISTLENGCTGTGCTNRWENYAYNNRLQPVDIQLGTSSNNAANYCLAYNYYSGVSNPTGCTNPPTQATTGNSGNVIGYYYKDSVNLPSTLSHQVTNTYDALNRLTNSTASAILPGSLSYNFPLTKGDRWNNSTCNGMGNPSGPGLTSNTLRRDWSPLRRKPRDAS